MHNLYIYEQFHFLVKGVFLLNATSSGSTHYE